MERKQYKTKEESDKEKGRDKFESTTPATKRENDYADAMGRQPGESPAEVDERCFNELMQNPDQDVIKEKK